MNLKHRLEPKFEGISLSTYWARSVNVDTVNISMECRCNFSEIFALRSIISFGCVGRHCVTVVQTTLAFLLSKIAE